MALGALPALAQAQTVVRGPYLHSGTPSSVVVKWRTDETTDSVVHYGLAPDSLTLSATITGLAAGSSYDGQVRATNDKGTGDWSDSGTDSTDANAAPVLSGAATASFAENGGGRVATYTATGPADAVLVWTLAGTDAGLFSIDEPDGALRFKAPPDFENPADDGGDNVYRLTVVVTDRGMDATQAVAVTVTDRDEPGTVALSANRPRMATELTASVADPDVDDPAAAWQWERSSGRSAPDRWTVIEGATSAGYTPAAADAGEFLRVTATYDDGGEKTVQAETANVVTAQLLSGLQATTQAATAESSRALRPAFSADVLHYAIGCGDDDTLNLTLSAGDDARLAVDGVQAASGNATVSVPVNGQSEVSVAVTGSDGASTTYIVHCLADHFLDIEPTRFPGATGVIEDLILISWGVYVAALDNNGVPRFRRWVGRVGAHFRLGYVGEREEYRYSYIEPASGTGNAVAVLDEHFTRIDTVTTVSPLDLTGRHDQWILPNGDYLIMSYEPATRDLSHLTFNDPDGNPYGSGEEVRDSAIQIVAPGTPRAGPPRFHWNSWDHMPLEDCAQHRFPDDYAHVNSMQLVDGRIIGSFRGCSRVLAIDVDTGDVVWRIGRSNLSAAEWAGRGIGPAPLAVVRDPEGEFCGQHAAQILPTGNLILFDNGVHCTTNPWTREALGRESFVYSRAVEYALDLDNSEAVFLRDHSLRGLRNRLGHASGHVDVLGNGDWLISWGIPQAPKEDGPGAPYAPDEAVTQVDPHTGQEKFALLMTDPDSEQLQAVRAIAVPPSVLARTPGPLTATIAGSPATSEVHRGPTDRPRVVVAFDQPVVDAHVTASSANVAGAEVESVGPWIAEGAPANAYAFVLRPAGFAPITFSLAGGTTTADCGSGGICTAGGTVLTEVGASHEIPPPVNVKSIESDATHPTKDPFKVTITFLKPVTGLTGSEIEVANGVGSNFSGSGAIYRLRVTPDADFEGEVTVTVPAGAAEDSAAIPNEADSETFAVDTRAPALVAANGATVNGATLTLTFDEVLAASNTAPSAFTVTGATTRSVTGVSVTGSTVEVTLNVPVLHGESGIEVDYDPPSRNPIVDAVGNPAASIADRGVTNNTAATTLSTALRLSLNEAQVAEAGPAKTVMVTGTLDRAARPGETTVVIEVGANGDTATEGTDYAAVDELTLTIPAYATSAATRFTLTPSNDRIDEGDESLTVSGSTTASGLSVTPSGGLSIGLSDNDEAPTLALSVDKSSFAEDGGTLTATVGTGSGSTYATAQTLRLSLAGSATESSDYTISGKTLTLPAGVGTGASTVTATVTGVDDSLDDDDETIEITGSRGGVAFGSRQVVTIEDDDWPALTVTFRQADFRVAEGGQVGLLVTLSAVPERPVTIPIGIEGVDGAEAVDYSVSPASLSFGTSETDKTLRVSASNDSVVDPGEGVTLSFGTPLPERISEGGIAETTVTIRDTDFTYAPAFVAGSGTTESDTDTYAVREAASALRLGLRLQTPRGALVADIVDPVVVTLEARENAGSRGMDEDYATERRSGTFGDFGAFDRDLSFAPGDFADDSACGCARAETSVSIDLFDDRVHERVEVFGLRLSRKSGRLSVSSQDITVKIDEDDAEPALTLDVNPGRIAEAGGTSTVTVSSGGGSTFAAAQSIRLDLSGTATRGSDYTIDATALTLPAGMGTDASTVTTTVRGLDDAIDDDAETIVLAAMRAGAAFADRTVTIADDDLRSTWVDLSVNPAQVREDAASATVRVTASLDAGGRSEDTEVSVTVGSVGDSADEGTDYQTIGTLTLTIDAGETEADTTFTLRPTNDDTAEGTEEITVDGSVSGLAVNSATLTLNDDDVESTEVALTVDPDEVGEAAGSRAVRVTGTLNGGARTSNTLVAVTVGAPADSAVEGTDYTEVGDLELSIPANRTDGSVTFTLRPTNDATAEGDETISVSGDVAGLTVTGTELVLADNDAVSTRLSLSLRPDRVSEGAVATDVTVTGTLDAGARETETRVTVTVGARADSAVSDTDYVAVSNQLLTIPANETRAEITFTLTPDDDAIAEGAESITVGGSAGGLTVEAANLTLSDNDTASRVVTLSVDPASVSEDMPEDVTVTAALNAGARAGDTEVRLTVGAAGDTAVPGTDYERVSDRTLTIRAGETGGTASFRLEPVDNQSTDGARTLSVTGSTTVAELRVEPATGAKVDLDDDDNPGVRVVPDTLTVEETGSEVYTVALQTRPTADVTVTIGGVSGDLSLDRSRLVFTQADWRDPQEVEVTAADDDDSVPDPDVTLTHRASGAAEYRGLRADLVVSIRENDPGLVFSASNLTVTEGESATYTVALATEPSGTVTVAVSGVSGDLSLDRARLAFTRGDWDEPQTVTVGAAEDDDASTDPAVTLTHRASDGGYDGIVGEVRVTVTENDGGGGTGGGGSGGGAANRPPVVEREIDDQALDAGEVLELDIRLNFYDRDQRALDYSVESADRSVATVAVDRNGVLTIRGIARGVTAITVTAADRRDERVSQAFTVTVRGPFLVGLFPRASDAVREGFVRVINRSLEAGEVTIEATDDAGTRLGPVTLSVAAGATAHFNSNDLEQGNASKGLPSGVGSGEGDWRLELMSALEIEVLSYIRTADGFLTSMHDSAPVAGGVHRVVIFNPGSNPNQVSRLRLLNLGSEEALVRITGIDDAGASPGESVLVAVPAGAARTVTAVALEMGTGGVEDALGDGAGKWRLRVDSDQPIRVMSLLRSPTGHLTNLSTAPPRDAGVTEAQGQAQN